MSHGRLAHAHDIGLGLFVDLDHQVTLLLKQAGENIGFQLDFIESPHTHTHKIRQNLTSLSIISLFITTPRLRWWSSFVVIMFSVVIWIWTTMIIVTNWPTKNTRNSISPLNTTINEKFPISRVTYFGGI